MTAIERHLATCRMVLATDLDGTFLGGSDRDRDRVYDWIRAERAGVGLIFVTGRDPGFIAELCGAGRVPMPDFVVADVGTTIAHVGDGGEITPIGALEAEIAEIWGDLGQTVPERLEGHPGLSLQDTAFRHRVSYDMEPEAFDDRAIGIVEEMGADALVSDNRFFDVLPRGVSKGPSLLRLVEHLGIERSRVLAAGDTMNDFSMLVAGVPAVAVGGSERPLLDALPDAAHIYRAEAIGAAGIVEAIEAFGLFPTLDRV